MGSKSMFKNTFVYKLKLVNFKINYRKYFILAPFKSNFFVRIRFFKLFFPSKCLSGFPKLTCEYSMDVGLNINLITLNHFNHIFLNDNYE